MGHPDVNDLEKVKFGIQFTQMIKLSQCEAIRGEWFLSGKFSSNFEQGAGDFNLLNFRVPTGFSSLFSQGDVCSLNWIPCCFKDLLIGFEQIYAVGNDTFAVSTKGKHRTVWWAGSCLYLSSPGIWFWGQHNMRSQDSLAGWALGWQNWFPLCVRSLRFYLHFFLVLLGIVCSNKFTSSNLATVKWYRNWNRRWKVPTIFLDFRQLYYFCSLTI